MITPELLQSPGAASESESPAGVDARRAPGLTEDEVRLQITQLERGHPVRPFDGRVPYPGLEPYGEAEAGFFFGREALTQQLLRRTTLSTCLLVAGPSGSGKSSLVRAGLLPALKGDVIPTSARWRYAIMTPGRNPLKALGQSLVVLSQTPEAEADFTRLASSDNARLAHWLQVGLQGAEGLRAVLVIDQFEETFTQVDSEDERQIFITQLCTAVQQVGGIFRLILTMRSDFIGACARYPGLNALVGAGLLQVGALSPDEVVRAVTLPALRVGLRVEPAMVARIVADIGQDPEALPLLQFALRDVFKAERDRNGAPQLTLEGYLRRGGLRQSLRRHAAAVFDAFTPRQQTVARQLLRGLLVIGQDQVVTRCTLKLSDLSFPDTPAATIHEVAHQLINSRLLTLAEDPGGPGLERAVTLSHEILLDVWPVLKAVVVEARASRDGLTFLCEAAAEWGRNNCDDAYLLGGTRLASVRKRVADHDLTVPAFAQRFLKASLDREPVTTPANPARRDESWRAWLGGGRALLLRKLQAFRGPHSTGSGETEANDPSEAHKTPWPLI